MTEYQIARTLETLLNRSKSLDKLTLCVVELRALQEAVLLIEASASNAAEMAIEATMAALPRESEQSS